MKIIVTHEKSQRIALAFRKRGHDAFSCDLQDCSGGAPEIHLKMDATHAIDLMDWDMIIMHPVCTYMALSGNAHYGVGKPKHYLRLQAIKETVPLVAKASLRCRYLAVEQPMSVLFKYLRPMGGGVQYIQPHWFGHPESKKTGLYLCNLPPLVPTNILPLPACGYWENQTPSGQNKLGPSDDRAEIRAITYQGIADAIAEQWGGVYDQQ